MEAALIGHTGFVGSNLLPMCSWKSLYNSKNIEKIIGKSFDLVVCAGVDGRKWWVDTHQREDWAKISRLFSCIMVSNIEKLVLISSIDAINPTGAYGGNRKILETLVLDRFKGCQILRLPALFGPGLKKNPLYDLLTDNETFKIPANATYQWFPVTRIADFVGKSTGIRTLTSVPIPMSQVAAFFFPNAELGEASKDAPYYDVRSDHDPGGYTLSKVEVLTEIGEFIEQWRGKKSIPRG